MFHSSPPIAEEELVEQDISLNDSINGEEGASYTKGYTFARKDRVSSGEEAQPKTTLINCKIK